MKIKVKNADFEEVIKKAKGIDSRPHKQWWALKRLVEFLSTGDFKATNFSYTTEGFEKLNKKEPCLILMNHSSFIDLKIAFKIFRDRRFSIVCTSDGFIGKNFLMKKLGCIPTQKFVPDVQLVRNMIYSAKVLKQSVLMYPEASYSFDGTATDLPDTLGRFVQVLGIPVVMIKTEGAFSRDPLYNNLQLRKVPVSAKAKYLLSPEDLKSKTISELNEILKKEFTFDNWAWQQKKDVRISEPFRADFLNRVLYKCPACKNEGFMKGKGINLSCNSCGKKYELTEKGFLKAYEKETEFSHVPDWYKWERECVKNEIVDGKYKLDIDVDICMLVDTKCIYRVGEGHLVHSREGFHLKGCNGKLDFVQKPLASYSVYSDYYWYELGDMICIGNMKALYYCFPKGTEDIVAKTRLAQEEIYKLAKGI